jgi:glycosyltransferase involved in cell wall biosynthesis
LGVTLSTHSVGPDDAVVERPAPATADASQVEVSVVMPCLNERHTVGVCVAKAVRALREAGIDGEVIVADNGSGDGSQQIAEDNGARVVEVHDKGYGSALMGGIAAARGRFVIMGDADDSYDVLEIPKFVEQLRAGHELVQGCRLPAGGGTVRPGAMPVLHRWWGNPMFSWLARRWFGAPIHDVYCGMRGFTVDLYHRLGQRCTGMEFATEMVIKASLIDARIVEVPITLHRDGRKDSSPHLKTFHDGWRTLRFFLLCTPRWLFLMPGMALILLGLIGYAIALPGLTVAGVTFDAHTLLFASLFILCGYQAILFAVMAKTFAITEGLLPADERFMKLFRYVNLERGLLLGAGSLIVGCTLLLVAVNQWRVNEFGLLDYARTMRWVIPGVLLAGLGFQTVLSSFFISILGLRRT